MLITACDGEAAGRGPMQRARGRCRGEVDMLKNTNEICGWLSSHSFRFLPYHPPRSSIIVSVANRRRSFKEAGRAASSEVRWHIDLMGIRSICHRTSQTRAFSQAAHLASASRERAPAGMACLSEHGHRRRLPLNSKACGLDLVETPAMLCAGRAMLSTDCPERMPTPRNGNPFVCSSYPPMVRLASWGSRAGVEAQAPQADDELPH